MSSFEEIESQEETADGSIVNYEEYENISNLLKNQYVDFNDLGSNLLSKIENNDIKDMICLDLIDFIDENYLDIDQYVVDKSQKTIVNNLAKNVYNFLFIDMYISIIPNFLETNKIYSLDEFKLYYGAKNDDEIKNEFVKTIDNIYKNVKKLESFDETIKNDEKYLRIIKKFYFYKNVLNMSESGKFINNYLLPMIHKNSEYFFK